MCASNYIQIVALEMRLVTLGLYSLLTDDLFNILNTWFIELCLLLTHTISVMIAMRPSISVAISIRVTCNGALAVPNTITI